uniref:Uncharacterized protein n=1 Tax=Anguilla anguilla TaxID=7936 RepID=A0A0E9TKS5_ANGAN
MLVIAPLNIFKLSGVSLICILISIISVLN